MLRDPRATALAGGVYCPHGDGGKTLKRGYDGPEQHLRRSACKACGRRFDDLTGTVLSGRHPPVSVWVLRLYFMGLNLSNARIAEELDLGSPAQRVISCPLSPGSQSGIVMMNKVENSANMIFEFLGER
jgi:hypothetical protein